MINTRLVFLKTFALSCIIVIAHGLSFFGVSIMMAAGCKSDQSPVADTSLSFKVIPYDDDDIVSAGSRCRTMARPGPCQTSGLTQLMSRDSINTTALAGRILKKEMANMTGQAFDREINDAIKNKQKFAFG
jgi:hypothetical protein